ncbi:MAG: inorganic phosphate transporter, partial [Oscillospiraceae bacterium]|nr:inorganic phosphate transporter [Oscillospiraceae bacterium]
MTILLTLLITGVIFVNGFTDAPGAITGVVVTRTLSYRAAVLLAAGCNLLGIAVMAVWSASVANTMLGLAGASNAAAAHAAAALGAAMLSIIIFAVGAWYFGIPTSESHALIAALAAGSLAIAGEADMRGWDKVAAGLVLSLVMGLLLGYLLQRFPGVMLARLSPRTLGGTQILGASASAFMHGAQDGQKFIAVLVLAQMILSARPRGDIAILALYIPEELPWALALGLGTLRAGGRRVDKV